MSTSRHDVFVLENAKVTLQDRCDPLDQDLLDELQDAWRSNRPLDGLLSRFVIATASRASGLWRVQDQHLCLAGFGWASDMPAEVSLGFQQATRHVSLDQIGLGIVRAAATGLPAIGRRDPAVTGLAGSASWIVKFAANSSLAVPIRHTTNQIIGVFAVSTASHIEENDSLWTTMCRVADRL